MLFLDEALPKNAKFSVEEVISRLKDAGVSADQLKGIISDLSAKGESVIDSDILTERIFSES